MKRILIYRHPECQRCAKIARLHHAFDWFDRIADTTAMPASGPLRPGQIVVQDLRTGELHHGAAALRLVYRQAIVYWPLLVLLWIPPIRRSLEEQISGGARENGGEIAASTLS